MKLTDEFLNQYIDEGYEFDSKNFKPESNIKYKISYIKPNIDLNEEVKKEYVNIISKDIYYKLKNDPLFDRMFNIGSPNFYKFLSIYLLLLVDSSIGANDYYSKRILAYMIKNDNLSIPMLIDKIYIRSYIQNKEEINEILVSAVENLHYHSVSKLVRNIYNETDVFKSVISEMYAYNPVEDFKRKLEKSSNKYIKKYTMEIKLK